MDAYKNLEFQVTEVKRMLAAFINKIKGGIWLVACC